MIAFAFLLMILMSACTNDKHLSEHKIYNYRSDLYMKVYTRVFSKSCALNGCHDGSFEPHLMTPYSAHQTLVWQAVVKNNLQNSFTYRVVPFDTAASVLHERISNCCFVNQDDRMPQNTIGEALPDEDIQLIADWILAGAPDLQGKIITKPNIPDFELDN
jgi:hypothetical protein